MKGLLQYVNLTYTCHTEFTCLFVSTNLICGILSSMWHNSSSFRIPDWWSSAWRISQMDSNHVYSTCAGFWPRIWGSQASVPHLWRQGIQCGQTRISYRKTMANRYLFNIEMIGLSFASHAIWTVAPAWKNFDSGKVWWEFCCNCIRCTVLYQFNFVC